MEIAESGRAIPTMLIVDDDPLVLRTIADRSASMGFAVVTATNGLQALIKAGEQRPDVLVIDIHLPEVDGLTVLAYLSDAAKTSSHVIVITGWSGEKTVEVCNGLDATCISKGPHFWTEFETCLAGMYPEREADIMGSAGQSARVIVKPHPRVLLVDDDACVRKMFFLKFNGLGADLLHAADATSGFWKARREHPTVIVADFCMPKGDARYLLRRLRSAPETCSIPVIVQSGRNLSKSVKQQLQDDIDGQPGAARILRKSFDGEELLDALQRFCGFAATPEAARPINKVRDSAVNIAV